MLMDELPPACAIVCTTNSKPDDSEPHEIITLLATFGLEKRDCVQIATFATGTLLQARR